MTQIDFYLLPKDGAIPVAAAVGRIAEKALARGHSIFVQAKDEMQARVIDDALWSFRPESFVPHELAHEAVAAEGVVIGWQSPSLDYDDVLINTSGSIPESFARFQRLVEIVESDETTLSDSREAWRFYRDRGYPLAKHDL